jgi:hypothetical protein
MKSYNELVKLFKGEVFTLEDVEIAVLKGLISGDGDISGRMASSHPSAKPPVSEERRRFLEKVAEVHIKMNTPWDTIGMMHTDC